MSVPGIFKLGWVSICCKFGIWISCIFLAGKGWCSGDSCLGEHLSKVGQLFLLLIE